jgi:hypothetical protein
MNIHTTVLELLHAKKWTDRHGENNRCIFATLLWMHLKWKIKLTGECLFFADINFDITLYLDIIAFLFSFKYTQRKSILQCTLDYLGVDYSVCGLSVHECFFNLPSIWLIQLRTMKKKYLAHKSRYRSVWLVFWRMRKYTEGGKCVRRARFSVCI